MNDTLSEKQVKWLTYLVYFLLAMISLVTVWNVDQIAKANDRITFTNERLPDKYVIKERYLCDQARIEKKLDSIEAKIDHALKGMK
jgi:hypothetical protein